MSWLDALAERPTAVVGLWLVLHSLDYGLTLAAARLGRDVGEIDAADYELNPLFRRPVAELRWWSRRFLLTLIGNAVVLYALFRLLPRAPELRGAASFVLGALVFTRVLVIGGHLQHLWFFARKRKRPDAVIGQVHYERSTALRMTALSHGTSAALLGVAASLAPHPALFGGAAGTLFLAVAAWALSLRRGEKRGHS